MYNNAPVSMPAPEQKSGKDLVVRIINYVVGGLLALVTIMSVIDLTKINDITKILSKIDSDLEAVAILFAVGKVLLLLGYLFVTLALFLKKKGLAIAGFILNCVYGFWWTFLNFILILAMAEEGVDVEEINVLMVLLLVHFVVFAVANIIACSAVKRVSRSADSKAWIAPVICYAVAWILAFACYNTLVILLEEAARFGILGVVSHHLAEFIAERITWFSMGIVSVAYAVFGVGFPFANERAKLAQNAVPVQPVYQQPVYQTPVQPVAVTPVAPVQPVATVAPVAPAQPAPVAPVQPAPVAPVQSTPVAPAQQEDSIAAELKRYKDLVDAGVITEEDYNEKKRQLLGL